MDKNSYFASIEKDFYKISSFLREVSHTLREKGYTFPIFSLTKKNVPVGVEVIDTMKYSAEGWIYTATYLDLLVEAKVITQAEDFKALYKDPEEYCCLLVIEDDRSDLIYAPYDSVSQEITENAG